MKTCSKCGEELPLSEFYKNGLSLRTKCKICHNKDCSKKVSNWRRNAKLRLVLELGGKCVDCGYEGPPFMYDFDHRDPTAKEFGIAALGSCRSYARMQEEVVKCDLVCANCHRFRTHRQRCTGCIYC